VFSTEKGDKLKVYAIPDSLLEARKDLNDNKSLALSESKGLISALEETGQETRQDGATLHHITYKVPNNYIEIELLDEDDNPEVGAAYQVIAPNGKVLQKGHLDENGYAEVIGVETDNVSVVFPDFDQNCVVAE